MARKNLQAWELAKQQHWVLTRQQLLEIGFTSEAIDVRVEDAGLHRVFAGVYAAGRPHLTREGYLMAAVLACGPGAALSDVSGAENYEILRRKRGLVHVSVPCDRAPTTRGIKVHRRRHIEVDPQGHSDHQPYLHPHRHLPRTRRRPARAGDQRGREPRPQRPGRP